jgi:hypothetical protein
MVYRILHLSPPMLENFGFGSLEDALDDLIGTWEDGELDLTGLIGFLNEQGVTVHGIPNDAAVSEATPTYILEGAGLMARGLIADRLDMQQKLADALAIGAGILILPVADPWFEPLALYCDRRRGDLTDLPATHPNPVIEAAVNTWLRRSSGQHTE